MTIGFRTFSKLVVPAFGNLICVRRVQLSTIKMAENPDYKSATSVHEFTVKNIKGEDVKLDTYKDHVCIIVNVASQCGLTANNYKQLNELHDQYAESKGYCFSASLPPMLTQAAISALDILEKKPTLIQELDDCCRRVHRAISNLTNFTFSGDEMSPIKHLYLKDSTSYEAKQTKLRSIAQYCMDKGVAMAVATYLKDAEIQCPEPSVRLAVRRTLTDDDISKICTLLDEAYNAV